MAALCPMAMVPQCQLPKAEPAPLSLSPALPLLQWQQPLPTFPFLLDMPQEPLELITVGDYRSPGNNESSDNY